MTFNATRTEGSDTEGEIEAPRLQKAPPKLVGLLRRRTSTGWFYTDTIRMIRIAGRLTTAMLGQQLRGEHPAVNRRKRYNPAHK